MFHKFVVNLTAFTFEYITRFQAIVTSPHDLLPLPIMYTSICYYFRCNHNSNTSHFTLILIVFVARFLIPMSLEYINVQHLHVLQYCMAHEFFKMI